MITNLKIGKKDGKKDYLTIAIQMKNIQKL